MHSVDMHEIHRSDWFDADCVVMRRLGQQERLGHERNANKHHVHHIFSRTACTSTL